MTDRPIIFSAGMVRALLDGRKTMTRRLLKPQPAPFKLADKSDAPVEAVHIEGETNPRIALGRVITAQEVRFAVGDRLYVREEYSGDYGFTGIPPRDWDQHEVWYWADGNPEDGDWTKPKPGMHMPRWASRLTLTVTGVKVERLNDITEADAIAEGMPDFRQLQQIGGEGMAEAQTRLRWPQRYFADLWNSLHGHDSWTVNPWVVAVSFSVQRKNIDGP